MRLVTFASFAALALLAVSGAAGRTGAAAESCPTSTPPTVLPEPAFTVGDTNTIRWERVPEACWDNEGADGKESTYRAFEVHARDGQSGYDWLESRWGKDATSETLRLYTRPSGASVHGRPYTFRVRRLESVCTSGEPNTGACFHRSARYSKFAPAVLSIHDNLAPAAAIEIAGGAEFTNELRVPVEVTAYEHTRIESGPGFVQLSTGPTFECPPRRPCTTRYGEPAAITLEPGPDGVRFVHARVFDKARGPADGPVGSVFGTPPGNVSSPVVDSIALDRTAPALTLSLTTTSASVGAAVGFDASRSADLAGHGADSGVDPASARWDFGDGTGANGLVAKHAYAAPGTYQVRFALADRLGNANSSTVAVTVTTAPAAPTPSETTTPPAPTATPTPTTVDRAAPTLGALGVLRRGKRTTLGFRVSERATLLVEVRRLAPRPQRLLASFRRSVRAGRGGVLLPAAVRRPGRYRVVVAARDAAGNVSASRALTFRTRARR